MKEEKFYEICDAAEAITENITDDYFPSVSEIDESIKAYGLEDQVNVLAYFASNPFKKQNNPLANNNEYIETVKYAKQKLQEVPLTE